MRNFMHGYDMTPSPDCGIEEVPKKGGESERSVLLLRIKIEKPICRDGKEHRGDDEDVAGAGEMRHEQWMQDCRAEWVGSEAEKMVKGHMKQAEKVFREGLLDLVHENPKRASRRCDDLAS
ncbi:hypothetical protein GOP47_0003184 [Adiantum capillus-veneris]|uniref:Uncharacterized protein n=1 Tax=Adiantum capillus-veneris TaxID=13818 RepID=A0A9D4ZRL2_ADICA|nr:hypothetical protein GOP47_0003184 [Adiantum capillus-veneris]